MQHKPVPTFIRCSAPQAHDDAPNSRGCRGMNVPGERSCSLTMVTRGIEPGKRNVGMAVNGATEMGNSALLNKALSCVLFPRLNRPNTARGKCSSANQPCRTGSFRAATANAGPRSASRSTVCTNSGKREVDIRSTVATDIDFCGEEPDDIKKLLPENRWQELGVYSSTASASETHYGRSY